MVLIGLALAVLALIVSILFFMRSILKNYKYGIIPLIMVSNLVLAIIVLAITAICDFSDISTKPAIIEEQIRIYEEQNSKIEADITSIVNDYQEYEKKNYDMIISDAESAIAVANVIPSLSSNELIVEKMKIYNENRKQIADLKMQLVEIEGMKWELYLGN